MTNAQNAPAAPSMTIRLVIRDDASSKSLWQFSALQEGTAPLLGAYRRLWASVKPHLAEIERVSTKRGFSSRLLVSIDGGHDAPWLPQLYLDSQSLLFLKCVSASLSIAFAGSASALQPDAAAHPEISFWTCPPLTAVLEVDAPAGGWPSVEVSRDALRALAEEGAGIEIVVLREGQRANLPLDV